MIEEIFFILHVDDSIHIIIHNFNIVYLHVQILFSKILPLKSTFNYLCIDL